jgi:hypothetical protein
MYPVANELLRKWPIDTRKYLGSVEMGMVFTLIILQIWVYRGQSILPEIFAVLLITAGCLARKETWSDIGLINRKYALISIAILVGKFFLPNIAFKREGFRGLMLCIAGYFVWALFQQLILNGYFANLLSEMTTSRAAASFFAGGIFSLIHFPNPMLMAITLLGGVSASYVFIGMKKRNLFVIALAHCLIAVTILRILPPSWHYSFVIGPGFWKTR